VAVPYADGSAILTPSRPQRTGFKTQFFDKINYQSLKNMYIPAKNHLSSVEQLE
jgi:hypothetical protein